MVHAITGGEAAAGRDTFIAAVNVSDVFADSSYQRAPDMTRVRKLAGGWDRRLAGVIEVSDRGPGAPGRYAVVDGQHRWLAVQLQDPGAVMVATIHENLSVPKEAALFDRLNRERRRPSTWDHWRARQAAGDDGVAAIEAAVGTVTLRDGRALCIDNVPRTGTVRCTATLEKLAAVGGPDLVRDALGLIVDIWGDRQDALDAPIVAGVGLVLHYLEDQIDLERLTDTLLGVLPMQLKTQALALVSTGTQQIRMAITIIALYNQNRRVRRGHRIHVTARTFGGGSRNARSVVSVPKSA